MDFYENICGALRDLAPFAKACNLTKSNTHPWVVFTFFKLYKWCKIAQRTTYYCYLHAKFQIHMVNVIDFKAVTTLPCDICLRFAKYQSFKINTVSWSQLIHFKFLSHITCNKLFRWTQSGKYSSVLGVSVIQVESRGFVGMGLTRNLNVKFYSTIAQMLLI